MSPCSPMVLTAAGTTMHLSDVLATYYDSLDLKKSGFCLLDLALLLEGEILCEVPALVISPQ